MLKANVAVLVSGGGTNLQALIGAKRSGALKSGELRLVVSSRAGAYALERAKSAGIPAVALDRRGYPNREAFEAALAAVLEQYRIDVLVLAGFLCILSPTFVARYPRRILNVHPSLLPAFGGEGYYGLKVHEAALKRGVKVTGATVHYVDEVADGGEILLQKAVRVHNGDTPKSLQQRVMQQAEWVLLPKALEQVCRRILREMAGDGRGK